MLEEKPLIKKVEGKKVIDYWTKALKLMKDHKQFLIKLEQYDKDNLKDKVKVLIAPYLTNPDFEPEKIKFSSEAAEGICKWVRALVDYDQIYKGIVPKKEALKVAKEKFRVLQEALEVK